MLSPAARAAAYLLAEALLLLLRALLSERSDLPPATVAALQHRLETLIDHLRHVARTGETSPNPASLPAALPASTTAPLCPRPAAPRDRPIVPPNATRPRSPNPPRHPTDAQPRQRIAPTPTPHSHALFVPV